MASTKVQRIMTQPINLIFRFLQSKARIQIWLFEQKDLRIEGRIIGFDEYMNLVLDEAEEINVKKDTRKSLGESDNSFDVPFVARTTDNLSIPTFYDVRI
uniref:Small nuclear ribonucleoprotein E n=1 Tax=Oryza punctata TaxID=4537 RepID=A0A0E0JV01_ORYPU